MSIGHAAILEMVFDGMSAAVKSLDDIDEFASLGLRTVDIFFSKVIMIRLYLIYQ